MGTALNLPLLLPVDAFLARDAPLGRAWQLVDLGNWSMARHRRQLPGRAPDLCGASYPETVLCVTRCW